MIQPDQEPDEPDPAQAVDPTPDVDPAPDVPEAQIQPARAIVTPQHPVENLE